MLRQHSACDSVEHSFKEKLSVQSRRNDKEEKELEVFEMLEGATLHSSFSRLVLGLELGLFTRTPLENTH